MKAEHLGTIEVLTVNVSWMKGTAKEPVSRIDLDMEGVVGDAHRGTPGRQVSLLDRTLVDRLEAEVEDLAVPPGAMGENVTFRCNPQVTFRIGDLISFQGTLLRVDRIGKECHGDGCAIFRSVGKCVMPSNGLFCTVVTPGRILPGEVAEILRSAL